MKYVKILLLVILLAMLLCFFVYGETNVNYTAEEARQIIDEFAKEEFRINTGMDYLWLQNDSVIKGPNNELLWVFNLKILHEDEFVIITFDATYGYITSINREYYSKATQSLEQSKTTIQNFLSTQSINIDAKDIMLRKGYPINREWVFDIKHGSNKITAFIEYDTGGFNGYQINDVAELMFSKDLRSAIFAFNDLFTDYRGSKIEISNYYPTKDASSNYIWKLKKKFNGDSYTIYSDANSYSYNDYKLLINDIEYTIDNMQVINVYPIFDNDYCKEVAKDFAIKYLGMSVDSQQIKLRYDEPYLPWFAYDFDYSDGCWIYNIKDKENDYDINVSECTGQVVEVYDSSETTDDNITPIPKDKARLVAEEFLKDAFPNKFKQTIYTGNRSQYGEGWTIHEYTRVLDNTIYVNQVLNVYLNPDGSIRHFYQSYDDTFVIIKYLIDRGLKDLSLIPNLLFEKSDL